MNFSKLKNLMDSFVNWRIPGCGCVVYKEHEPIFKYSAGYSDVTRQLPFDTDNNMLFMYSCSKPITVCCAMKLFEEGKFDLNEPVSKYISEMTSHLTCSTMCFANLRQVAFVRLLVYALCLLEFMTPSSAVFSSSDKISKSIFSSSSSVIVIQSDRGSVISKPPSFAGFESFMQS